MKAVKANILGVDYAYDEVTGNLYDYDSYMRKNPIKVGILDIYVDDRTGKKKFRIIRV